MKITQISFIYFSPTGTTKGVLALLKNCFDLPVREYDLTDYPETEHNMNFGSSDLVIFAFPVYSGRVPETFRERIGHIKGNHTLSAIVAAYGNREYDDSLLEMADISDAAGFLNIGAIAVVTEHSVIRSIGAGRPNEKDRDMILTFGEELLKRADELIGTEEEVHLKLPGNRPYRRYEHIPLHPLSTSSCNGCLACVKTCPVEAITYDGQCHTDKKKCVGCMKCIRICPQRARTNGKIKMMAAETFMKLVCRSEKQSELFL